MTTDLNAPVLTKKKKTEEQESLDFLKSIDSRLEDISQPLKKKPKQTTKSVIVKEKTIEKEVFSSKGNKSLDKNTQSMLNFSEKVAKLTNTIVETNKKEKPEPVTEKNDEFSYLRESIAELSKLSKRDIKIEKVPEPFKEKYVEEQTKILRENFVETSQLLEHLTKEILSKPKLEKKDTSQLNILAKLQAKLDELKPEEKVEVKVKKEKETIVPDMTDPIADLQRSVDDMNRSIIASENTQGLSRKDAKEYQKKQLQAVGQQQEELTQNIQDTRKEILAKSTLSEQDKELLKRLDKFEKDNKEYQVTERTFVGKKVDTLKDSFGSDIAKGNAELADATVTGLLGPLNLVLAPIGELFGIKFSNIMDKLFSKDDEYTKKGRKIKAKRSDVLKSNPEIVWLADEQKKLESKTTSKEEKKSGLPDVGNILETALGTALPSLISKAAPLLLSAIGTAAFATVIAGAFLAVGKLRTDQDKAELEEAKKDQDKKHAAVASAVSENLGIDPTSKEAPTNAYAYQKAVEEKTQIDIKKKGNYWAMDQDGTYYVATKPDMSDKVQWLFNTQAQKQSVFDLADKNTQAYKDAKKKITPLDYLSGATLDKLMTENKGRPMKFHSGGYVPDTGKKEVDAVLLPREHVLTEENDDKFKNVLNFTNSVIQRLDRNNRVIEPEHKKEVMQAEPKQKKVENHFDSQSMQIDLSQISQSISDTDNGEAIVDKLTILIDVMKQKNFNNIMQTNIQQVTDYDVLRKQLA